jgi:hypothetical protein
MSSQVSGGGVTLGELWRQGERIEQAVGKLDAKLDTTNDTVTRHDEMLIGHSEDIARIRAELESKRITTASIAGVVATVITVLGEIIGHLR